MDANLKIAGKFTAKAFRDGELLWEESWDNLVVNTGITAAMNNGIQSQTWYVGLLASGTPNSGTTMAGISEVTAYDETARPAWTKTQTTTQITNAASPAEFTISTNTTVIHGAFIASSATKGETASTLFAAKPFAADKTLDDNDVIQITYEVNGSST